MSARAPSRGPGLAVCWTKFASVLLLLVVRCGAFIFVSLLGLGSFRFHLGCVSTTVVIEQAAVSVARFSFSQHETNGIQGGIEITRSGTRGLQTYIEYRARVIVEPPHRVRKLLGEDRTADALRGRERSVELVELVMEFIKGRDRGLGDAALMRVVEHELEGRTGGG
eukprot:6213427-Pleurochrysis_carterae.AAC.2